MKKTITELCKREGKKSQVKIGDMKESISQYHNIIAEELVENMIIDFESPVKRDQSSETFAKELFDSIVKKANVILKKKKKPLTIVQVRLNSSIKINEAPVKKVTKKKKA